MNKLVHLQEFQQVLSNYHASGEALDLLSSTPLVVLVSITAAGRNTIINELVDSGDYHYVVSDTTRRPRKNNGVMEQNGVEYWFRKEEDLLADLKAGLFLEAAIIHGQQVSGISLRELQAAQDEHKTAITEIEVQGVQNILNSNPSALLPIFIVPPSYDIWIDRWAKRGTITEDEKRRRMTSARDELATALASDKYRFVINDRLDQAVQAVSDIVKGVNRNADHQTGRRLAQEILDQLVQEIAQ